MLRTDASGVKTEACVKNTGVCVSYIYGISDGKIAYRTQGLNRTMGWANLPVGS